MSGARWDEAGLSEDPAIATLVELGWTYVPPDRVLAERDSTAQVFLPARLRRRCGA